jgi:hypothetical protein
MNVEQSVPKRRHTKFRRRGITQMIIIPLKAWETSNIWEQLQGITILFREQTAVWERLLSFGSEFLVYSLLSKNVKIKIYKAITVPVILFGCET